MRPILQAGTVLALVVTAAWGQPTTISGKSGSREEASQRLKADLSPQSLGKLHALIRPHEDEWLHFQVCWLTDVVAARKKAAAEDKPIIICYTGGAGYNEPLGVC